MPDLPRSRYTCRWPHAAARVGAVVRFKGIGKRRVKGGRDIGGEALGGLAGGDEVRPRPAQSCCRKWKVYILFRPVTPSEPVSLYISQHADGSVGRGLRPDLGHQGGIGVDAVVVAVGTDHGAVQADITGLVSGDDLDLGAGEVAR